MSAIPKEQETRVLGLDISTYVGMSLVNPKNPEAIVGKCVNFPKARGPARLQLIAQEVRRVISVWKPTQVVIEGYAIYRASSVVTVVACGTIVRQTLYELGYNWLEVPPTTLKKWVTGKGTANKAAMADAVLARWGYQSPSDDIVDAVALAQVGVAIHLAGGIHTLGGVSQGW